MDCKCGHRMRVTNTYSTADSQAQTQRLECPHCQSTATVLSVKLDEGADSAYSLVRRLPPTKEVKEVLRPLTMRE